MNARETLLQTQNRLLASHAHARDLLRRYPGVVDVGVGVKERRGGYTDELAYRVYVREKAHALDLGADGVLPREVLGMGVDVVVAVPMRKATCATVNEAYLESLVQTSTGVLIGGAPKPSTKRFRALRPGVRINRGTSSDTAGTLGAIVKLGSGATAFLTAGHVLTAKNGDVGKPIGQPSLAPCECNWVGKIHDIEIVEFDAGVVCVERFIGVLNEIIVNTESRIRIEGMRSPVDGTSDRCVTCLDAVIKYGAASGRTEGVVIDVAYNGGKDMLIAPAPGVEVNATAVFAIGGDSGAVILYEDTTSGSSKYYAVGLLHEVAAENTAFGVASHMPQIVTRFELTFDVPDGVTGFDTKGAGPNGHGDLLEGIDNGNLSWLAWGSPSEQLVPLELWDDHFEEVIHLINTSRPVKLAWNRANGPAFAAAWAKKRRVPSYEIPREINGISYQEMVLRLCLALKEHGSQELGSAINDLFHQMFKQQTLGPQRV